MTIPTRDDRLPGAAFQRDGYVLLPSFLSRRVIDRLRATIERFRRAADTVTCQRPNNTLVPLRWSDRIVAGVLNDPHRTDRLAQAIGATDLRWVSGYLSIKEPRSGPLWWHQDWWCWNHSVSFQPSAAQVAMLCYLTPTDERHGALRVLPGTHHTSTPLHSMLPEAHTDEADTLPSTHPAMDDHPDQVTLALNPGDTVITDYRLLHGTHPHEGRDRRDAVLLTFAPAWRHLPADVRGHLIQHPSQPTEGEVVKPGTWAERLLPSHRGGARADLNLNRTPPATFSIPSADSVPAGSLRTHAHTPSAGQDGPWQQFGNKRCGTR